MINGFCKLYLEVQTGCHPKSKDSLGNILVAQMKRMTTELQLPSMFIAASLMTNLIPTCNVQHNLKCYNSQFGKVTS